MNDSYYRPQWQSPQQQYAQYSAEPPRPAAGGAWDWWPQHPGVNLLIGVLGGMILALVLKKASL